MKRGSIFPEVAASDLCKASQAVVLCYSCDEPNLAAAEKTDTLNKVYVYIDPVLLHPYIYIFKYVLDDQ